jgi:hypothetical protein
MVFDETNPAHWQMVPRLVLGELFRNHENSMEEHYTSRDTEKFKESNLVL